MNKHDESICLLVGKNNPTTRGISQALSSEGITTSGKQEVSEIETISSHWSGQPGQDLFFNGWKLLF